LKYIFISYVVWGVSLADFWGFRINSISPKIFRKLEKEIIEMKKKLYS